MSISTYAELKVSIENWAKRSDIGGVIDTFIDLAEADMWQRLEIRDMDTRATATTGSDRFLALPAGFIKMRKLTLVSGSVRYTLRQQTPESMNLNSASGIPTDFTVTSQLEFNRTPGSAYTAEMQYYKELDALSASNTSNGVLTRFPNIYLYGSLMYFAQWAMDDNMLAKYSALFYAAINDANEKDRKGRHGPAPQMRIEGSTP